MGSCFYLLLIFLTPQRVSEGLRGPLIGPYGGYLGVSRVKAHLQHTLIGLKTPQVYSKMILEHFGKNRFFSYLLGLRGPQRAVFGRFQGQKTPRKHSYMLKNTADVRQNDPGIFLKKSAKIDFFIFFDPSEGLRGPQRASEGGERRFSGPKNTSKTLLDA